MRDVWASTLSFLCLLRLRNKGFSQSSSRQYTLILHVSMEGIKRRNRSSAAAIGCMAEAHCNKGPGDLQQAVQQASGCREPALQQGILRQRSQQRDRSPHGAPAGQGLRHLLISQTGA